MALISWYMRRGWRKGGGEKKREQEMVREDENKVQ